MLNFENVGCEAKQLTCLLVNRDQFSSFINEMERQSHVLMQLVNWGSVDPF